MTDPIEEAKEPGCVHHAGHKGACYVGTFVPTCDYAQREREIETLRTSLTAAESKLAAVTAERDAHEVTIERLTAERMGAGMRANAAESALARALEAMPTVHESETLRNALEYDAKAGGLTIGRYEPWASASAALDRLDAFRAGQAMTADRAAQRASFAAGNVAIDRDPDARRTVAVEIGRAHV